MRYTIKTSKKRETPPPVSSLRQSLCALYLMQRSYSHQSQILSLFYRWLPDQSAWCLPILYLLLADLRDLAEHVSEHDPRPPAEAEILNSR